MSKGGSMFNKTISLTLCVVFSTAILVACKQDATPTQTTLPSPTNTRAASATAAPTSTPTPAPTQTPTTKATSIPTKTITPTVSEGVSACPGAPDISLKLDDWAMVSTDPPLPNKIRSQPGISGELIGQVQPGENVLVVEGPTCADGYTWWFGHRLDGLEGWAVEGEAEGYWLVDPIYAWYHLPKPLTSQGVKTYDLHELKISADTALIGD